MKRSNRLILLIGFFLAIVAFVGIVLLMGQTKEKEPSTTTTAVTAAVDIPLGTKITEEMVAKLELPIGDAPAGGFKAPADVIGQTVRTDVLKGAYITNQTFSVIATQTDIGGQLDPGLRAISVKVDQVTGIGTLIKPGDRVDVVLALSEDQPAKNPIVVETAPTKEGQPPTTVRNFVAVDALLNNTTVKVLVENAQVVGTLLPPPTTTPNSQGETTQSSTPTVGDQTLVVILAVTPQQAELIRFTQLDGNLSLILRSPKDDTAEVVKTTGVTVRELVDRYGVLPPKIVLTVQP